MPKCKKCSEEWFVAYVSDNDPNYLCPSCEDKINKAVKDEKQIQECLKCGSTSNLFVHKGFHLCPKCLSERVLEL